MVRAPEPPVLRPRYANPPRKRFGQHFLEPQWVKKVVAAIAPRPDETLLEIGPGRGALTRQLAPLVERLAVVEIDRDLARDLQAREWPNVVVHTADVLDVDLAALARATVGDTGRRVRVAGNLPFNISSPLLFRLLAAARAGQISDATLMLQREVAERLVARPGTHDYGVLTLSVQMGADVSLLLSLPPGAFRPPPAVRAAVVRLTFREPPSEVIDPVFTIELVRAAFTQRRKTLGNALAPFAARQEQRAAEVLHRTGIDPRRRPETLTLLEFARVANALLTAREP